MGSPYIVTVCTANICRSPAAASLLRRGLAEALPQAVITSAGTAAISGRPACDLSSALVGGYVATSYPTMATSGELAGHRSRRVSRHDLDLADLVLALDRTHRAALAQLHPGRRPRTFTLRQAAAAAVVITAALRNGSVPEGAPMMPTDPSDRFSWWVEELDAIRAYVTGEEGRPVGALSVDAQDVPDPHVVGYQYHPMAVELIVSAVTSLNLSVAAVMEYRTPTS